MIIKFCFIYTLKAEEVQQDLEFQEYKGDIERSLIDKNSKFTYNKETYFNFEHKNAYVVFKLTNNEQKIKKDSELLKIGRMQKMDIEQLKNAKKNGISKEKNPTLLKKVQEEINPTLLKKVQEEIKGALSRSENLEKYVYKIYKNEQLSAQMNNDKKRELIDPINYNFNKKFLNQLKEPFRRKWEQLFEKKEKEIIKNEWVSKKNYFTFYDEKHNDCYHINIEKISISYGQESVKREKQVFTHDSCFINKDENNNIISIINLEKFKSHKNIFIDKSYNIEQKKILEMLEDMSNKYYVTGPQSKEIKEILNKKNVSEEIFNAQKKYFQDPSNPQSQFIPIISEYEKGKRSNVYSCS